MKVDLKPFKPSGKLKTVSALCMISGIAALLLVFRSNPDRAWVNILLNSYFYFAIAIGAGFFVALQFVANAGWATVLRRVPEAITVYLPIAALTFASLYFGMHHLYHWTHLEVVANDVILSAKQAYLNPTAFFIRMAIFFGGWIVLSTVLRRTSSKQDQNGDVALTRRNVVYGIIYIVFFAFSSSLASYDWIMSIEPHWFSTMFGVYAFAVSFVTAIAAIILFTLYLNKQGALGGLVNENHLHDLGKLLFAFSVFWAYIWFSQYLLIWYSNIPEEGIYYTLRSQEGWKCLFWLNPILSWGLPFLLLISRNAKRKPRVLGGVAVLVLVAHWLDLFLMIAPGVYSKHAGEAGKLLLGWQEVVIALGFFGLFIGVVSFAFSKRNMVPLKDPYLEESAHHHQ